MSLSPRRSPSAAAASGPSRQARPLTHPTSPAAQHRSTISTRYVARSGSHFTRRRSAASTRRTACDPSAACCALSKRPSKKFSTPRSMLLSASTSKLSSTLPPQTASTSPLAGCCSRAATSPAALPWLPNTRRSASSTSCCTVCEVPGLAPNCPRPGSSVPGIPPRQDGVSLTTSPNGALSLQPSPSTSSTPARPPPHDVGTVCKQGGCRVPVGSIHTARQRAPPPLKHRCARFR
mmetsp:Transcript_76338/g.205293  ORF Transcript_76338/g.205293 Transcript_76338/m.205293 type:complete len:235 (+) Transcript_76338:164-868(+)